MKPESLGSESLTKFFLCSNYAGKGCRVILLCGSRWRPAMMAHYGAIGEPFYVRPRRKSEPETYPNGHPWGWVYTVQDALKDEVRQMSAEQFAQFKERLGQAVAIHDAQNEMEPL